MLVELQLVEQRDQAVLEVINDGVSVSAVAIHFGVTRSDGAPLAAPPNGCPGLPPHRASCPHQMSPTAEAHILALQRRPSGLVDRAPPGSVRSVHTGTTHVGAHPCLVIRPARRADLRFRGLTNEPAHASRHTRSIRLYGSIRHHVCVLSEQLMSVWCRSHLGAVPGRVLFRRQHVSEVIAVELTDKRRG